MENILRTPFMRTLNKEFGYLIEKLEKAPFAHDPFKHVIIDNFLSEEHFNQITSAKEIKRPVFLSTEQLIEDLLQKGYDPQPFPGCINNIDQYLKALNSGSWDVDKELLEGFGMAFRLNKYQTPILKRITQFLNSKPFKTALEKKFNITRSSYVETAIQKYLQGYEISPHPDIRKKAATYMLNINTDPASETINIHTYLCRFKPEKQYIYDFWKNNSDIERCWVPWDWCTTKIKTNTNNSIVLFSPSNESLHAVKLDYDHLNFQRTQIYGNLWYNKTTPLYATTYKDIAHPEIDIENIKKNASIKYRPRKKTLKEKIISNIPNGVKQVVKKIKNYE